MKDLANAFHTAIKRRTQMSLATNAMRLVNGVGDGLDGLLVDRYHKHFHVQMLTDHWYPKRVEICRLLSSSMPLDYLIVKSRQGLTVKQEVLVGKNPQTIVEENGIKFAVNLDDGLNCGLFLDMRANRRMIGDFAKSKKVLNCFAYTCAFGLYARRGGAQEVINTDISRKILERGKNNYELNALSCTAGEFIKADSLFFLERALKKKNFFDLIIIDPPSFARHEGNVFQIKRDLPKTLASAMAVLNPGGSLWVTTNYSLMRTQDLERILAGHLNGRRVKTIKRVGQDKDFVGSNSFKESYLAGLWVKFL